MTRQNNHQIKIIPLYSSDGDVKVFLQFPYLYNHLGEWVGWVSYDNDVYSVLGVYIGYISKDKRILSRRFLSNSKPRLDPPSPPSKFLPPATTPLAPLFSEILTGTVDILLEEPEKLHTIDSGDLKPDLD